MSKNDILKRINGLNEFMLSNSNKQILLLKIPNIYTCNKAIAIVDRNTKEKDWYSVDNKSCFRTWDEIEAFIDGLCVGKNTDFGR